MRLTIETSSESPTCKCSDFSAASAMFKLMHKLNANYDLDHLYDEVNNRKGLVATYIYLLTDKLIRKHTQVYLNQFDHQTVDVLVSMPQEEIRNSTIRDINQFPFDFTESLENLVWSINSPSSEGWDSVFYQHVDKWSGTTGILPKEFRLETTQPTNSPHR